MLTLFSKFQSFTKFHFKFHFTLFWKWKLEEKILNIFFSPSCGPSSLLFPCNSPKSHLHSLPALIKPTHRQTETHTHTHTCSFYRKACALRWHAFHNKKAFASAPKWFPLFSFRCQSQDWPVGWRSQIICGGISGESPGSVVRPGCSYIR